MFAVYVLNLPAQLERRAHMQCQLEVVSGTPIWIQDARGRRYDRSRLMPRHVEMLDKSLLGDGEVGCWAAHLMALTHFVETDADFALVLEDDVQLPSDMDELLSDISDVRAGWDIIRLSGKVKSAACKVQDLSSGRILAKFSRVPLGMGAYVASKQGASKILHKTPIGDRPIDVELRSWWRSDLKTYGVYPFPVEQDVLPVSLIDSLGVRTLTRRRGASSIAGRVSGAVHNVGWLGPRTWLRCTTRNLRRHGDSLVD